MSAAKARSRARAAGSVRRASQERSGTRYAQDGAGFRPPADRHLDRRLGPRQADILDQESEQLFAIGMRRRRGLPQRRQVLRQRQDPGTLRGIHQADRRRGPGGRFPLQALHLGQPRLPIPLQRPPDQAVLRIDRQEPAPGQLRLVARPLHDQLPLAVHPARLLRDLIDGRHRHLELRRSHGLQEDAGHRRIDPVAAERLASLLPVLLMELITFIQGDLAVVHVTDRHAPPAPAAQDEALEQRRTFAERPAMLLVL